MEIYQQQSPSCLPAHLVSGERQILINLHVLFHVFQGTGYSWRFGNLSDDTDANYAVFADVEGPNWKTSSMTRNGSIRTARLETRATA